MGISLKSLSQRLEQVMSLINDLAITLTSAGELGQLHAAKIQALAQENEALKKRIQVLEGGIVVSTITVEQLPKLSDEDFEVLRKFAKTRRGSKQ